MPVPLVYQSTISRSATVELVRNRFRSLPRTVCDFHRKPVKPQCLQRLYARSIQLILHQGSSHTLLTTPTGQRKVGKPVTGF